ncbi:Calcineurin-binding protein cabin-1 [Trichinella pseudospiralis]|uniref:Calcineurin-binding protein cabin-1 n=1 Tax=Trichinella pseudospiralis TaxID=6337 RepID=A0A0V0XG45_TRIPS|nr:Calcineurin-binding protein cabin-1 [Trichinella pseudospiralis]
MYLEISSDHETESDEKQDEEAEDEHYFPEDEVPYFRGLGEDSSDSFMETDTSVKVAKFTPNEDASPLYFQGLNAPKPRRKSCFRELKYKNRRVSRKPIEVQENHALNKYKRAVTLLATGRKDKACSMLRSLLKTPFLKKKKSERSSTGINNVAKSLRYAIFKNLAKVEARKGDHDSAMALYLKAFKLCSSDWTLCVEFGIEATKNLNMVLARAAFCQALSISPNDMFVLDKYISTCYILEDYIGCIESIGRALELDSNYLRGYVIRDEIFKRNKYLELFTIEQLKNKHFEYSSEDAERILMPLNKIAERLHKPLANINAMKYVKPPCNVIIYNLSDFGNALCDVYDYLTEKREHMGKLIDWTDIWNFVLAEQFGDFDAMQREISVATNAQTPPQQVIANDEQMETGRDSGIKNAVGKESSKLPLGKGQKEMVVFKRRSARLIPGFRMEDPEAFGPLTTRRLTLRDKLCLLFSEELPFKDPEQTAQHRDGDGGAGAGKSEQEGRINLMALELKFHFRSDEMPKKQHLLGHAIGITNIADLCQDCLFAIRAYHMLARLFELNNVDAAAGFYFKRCYQLMLEEDLPEMRVASCGLTICRDELYKKSEMADLNQLLGQVEQLIEDGVIGLAVEILEKSLHTSVEHLHQQVFVRQMMLLSCYKQLGLFTKAAPLFLTLLDQLVADYRRSDVGERRAVWRPIQRLLDAGSWLFQGDAQASVFQPSFCAPVAQQLIELIVFADEYPFYKRDIPDQCWLLPWIFLYNILNWFEMAELVKNGKLSPPSTVFQRKSPPRDLRMVTNSLNVLKLAHDVLGEKSLCMINDGQLLEFFMEEILRTLRHPNLVAHPALDGLLETMNEAEQCIFCMCRYPMKRKRNLRDHSVAAADLTWNRTITLFDFIIPEKLPQCDSAPNESVSSEALQLLLRMETLVPESLHLNSCYDTEWDEYFFDDRVDPPSLTIDKLVPVVSTLYYVIADHYLKYQEFSKAVDYYLQDLLINPNRFDSLAGLAQAASGIIDARLFSANLCFTMEEEAHIYRWSRITVKAYEKALELDKTHVTFWMEFGNSAYLCHSFYRRLINRLHDRGQLSKEQKVVLKKRRNNLLDIAEKAFLIVSKNANFQSEGKDQWLVFYMLGKIGEKRNDSLEKLLALYFKSIYSLYADGVQLVESIRANNPPRGSLEMLELYYRIHVCILKNFILDRISFDRLENVCNFLALVRGSPCSAITDVVLKNNSSSSLLTANSQVYGDSGIDEILNRKVFNYENSQYICFGKSTLSGPFVSLPNPTNSKHAEAITMIMEMCRDAFVSCIQRFSGGWDDLLLTLVLLGLIYSFLQTSCASMEILYGAGRSGNPPLSNALFHCRRQTNLFDGICSYPVDDISRPGCFYMHMRRSVKLLIDCAITYDDLETLCEILWYLRKKPEVDRVYLLEDDRKAFLNELQRYVSDFITTRYASMSAENQRKTICMICKLYFSVIRVPGFSVSDWRQLIVGMYLTMSGKQDGDFTQALSFARSLMETREYGSATLSRHPVLKSKGRKRMKSSITNAEDGSSLF